MKIKDVEGAQNKEMMTQARATKTYYYSSPGCSAIDLVIRVSHDLHNRTRVRRGWSVDVDCDL